MSLLNSKFLLVFMTAMRGYHTRMQCPFPSTELMEGHLIIGWIKYFGTACFMLSECTIVFLHLGRKVSFMGLGSCVTFPKILVFSHVSP